ncbi:MAG: helix-turn-helix transcriptional regulator [Myxococcota bacterium]|nr:helix-turn-helix transcriptional regulator [Myxococcota bacterium]
MYKKYAQEQFGEWLRGCREERQKKRGALAKAIGYQNLSKGSNRIVRWEKGEEDPDPKYHAAIQDFLEIPPRLWEEKRAVRAQWTTLAEAYQRSKLQVEEHVQALLANHSDFLLSHQETILQTSNFRHIQLHGLLFSMAYIGGGSTVQLGALLKAWGMGNLQTEKVRIFSGGCSPLSGRHQMRGFSRTDRTIGTYQSLFPRASAEIGPMIALCKKMGMGMSHWSLAQLLAQFGISIDKAEIYAGQRLWGSYDFHRSVLSVAGKEISLSLSLESALSFQPTHVESEEHWEASRGRRVSIGDISTGQFGVYQGDRWSIREEEGIWSLKAGQLIDPEGFPVLRWTADIPTAAQEKLVGIWRVQEKPVLP